MSVTVTAEPRQLGWEAPVELPAGRILTLSAFDHDMGGFSMQPSHDAGNPVPVLQLSAADRAYRFLPITFNKKHPVPRCKQDRNLVE